MARTNHPIDPLTVLWEAQNNAVLTGTNPADVLDFLRQPVGSPQHWAERIYQRRLLATAHTAAATISALTDDHANAPHYLILGARRTLNELTRIRVRRRAPPPAMSPTAPLLPPTLTTTTPLTRPANR
jgi:hypothetical protein